MHRTIEAAIVALVLFAGSTAVCFAQTTKGTSGNSSSPTEGIGSTSSTHNPRPSSPGPTGMENRKPGETGTDSSTHNPTK
jgi:hypothetical protein